MAVTRAALRAAGGFDAAFTTAGDDVDLSWRLAELGETLAYAPGATVIHERRATLRAYLRQQRGYGRGEGLLYHRYPLRDGLENRVYGGASWLGSWFGGARVYYGAFGRGLFQSVYASGVSPALELPLTAVWIGAAMLLIIAGGANRFLAVLGAAGLGASVLAAALGAAFAPMPRASESPFARAWLFVLNLLGPAVRSFARERAKWRFAPETTADATSTGADFSTAGTLAFARSDGSASTVDSTRLLAAMRSALVRRGLTVAVTDGYQSYDLEIMVPPAVRVPINALRAADGHVSMGWRMRVAALRTLIVAAVSLVVLAGAGCTLDGAITAVAVGAALVAVLAYRRARRVPAILALAAAEAAAELGLRMFSAAEGDA